MPAGRKGDRDRWIICLWLIPTAVSFLPTGEVRAADNPVINLQHPTTQPDFERLPRFFSSDPKYDAFVNEYFMRHLSVDQRGVYLGGGPILGATNHMWVIEWDCWFLPWIDRGAMGLARQDGNPVDVPLTTLLNTVVDKYGYTWGAAMHAEDTNVLGGTLPTFGWPWPKYNRNTSVTRPTGWEFNDINDGARGEWTGQDIALEPGYVDHSLVGKITGPHPRIISPTFDVDVFQVPILEIDVAFKTPSGKNADRLIDGLAVYWTTDTEKEFSRERMVTPEFADLPPKEFPQDYLSYVSGAQARYPLYFPMYLHPQWGRHGRRITRLMLEFTGPEISGATVSLNYVRATYDVRMSTTNATLINATYRFFMWSGDEQFLAAMMPKLRKSMIFLNEHLKGRQEGLLNFDWMVGKDGLGGEEPGHGLIGSYWDLLPAGRYDIESSVNYFYSLQAMAELERIVRARHIAVPPVQVIGPDNQKSISYTETPESLQILAGKTKSAIEKRFWNEQTGRFCRNIDVDGRQQDYGFLHFNLLTLMFGAGTTAQRDSILDWLDGRVIPGDTSTGSDIYKWRFAPRTSTKWNEHFYFWIWNVDRKAQPNSPIFVYGNQIQDGGAVPFTSLFELIARTRTGDQKQIDRAFERTREIQQWFDDVKAAGGHGNQFYRAYYDNHPERGRQQSPNPGGLGLDHEFLSDAALGSTFVVYAFLGLDVHEDGILEVAPAVPSALERIGANNIFFRGNYLTIEAGKDYVSLVGSRLDHPENLKVRIRLRPTSKPFQLLIDGHPVTNVTDNPDGTISVLLELKPSKIEVVASTPRGGR